MMNQAEESREQNGAFLTGEEENTGRNFPADLRLYPSQNDGKGDRAVLVTFILAFVGVGLFSVTRLFLVHWVFLIPVSLGSATLLGVILILRKYREKPEAILHIGASELRFETLKQPSEPAVTVPLDRVTIQSVGSGEPAEEGIRLLGPYGDIATIRLVQVRDVSLFRQIARYFSLPADRRPAIMGEQQSAKKKGLSWFLVAYGLIALLLTAWAVYEHTSTPGPDVLFPVSPISR